MAIQLTITIPESKISELLAKEEITREEFVTQFKKEFFDVDPKELCPGASLDFKLLD